jgi:hypothetical protein
VCSACGCSSIRKYEAVMDRATAVQRLSGGETAGRPRGEAWQAQASCAGAEARGWTGCGGGI